MIGSLEVVDSDMGSNRGIYAVGWMENGSALQVPNQSAGGQRIHTVLKSGNPDEDKGHINQNMSEQTE